MDSAGKFPPHPQQVVISDTGRLASASTVLESVCKSLSDLAQTRKGPEVQQAQSSTGLRSHDIITRDEALQVIYFRRGDSANYAIKLEPTKTISDHLKAITSQDKRAKKQLLKASSGGHQMVFSVPLKGIEGKGKVYTIVSAKKNTMDTVLVSDMNVLLPAVITIFEEPVDEADDGIEFEDLDADG